MGSTGSELWKTDGTAAGTVMVKDINSGAGSGSPLFHSLQWGIVFQCKWAVQEPSYGKQMELQLERLW